MSKKLDRTQTAVIYVRTGSAEPDAVDRQRKACERIAAKYGLTVIREYIDAGRPARYAQQPGLQQLLEDLEARCDAAFVVVWDHARIARDMAQLEMVVDRLRVCEADIATITGVTTVTWPKYRDTDHHE